MLLCMAMQPELKRLLLVVTLLSAMFFVSLVRHHYHRATNFNCQLCVALLHLRFLPQTWPVCLASLAAINLLFLWYRDEKEYGKEGLTDFYS